MAAIFLARRVTSNISKASIKDHSCFVDCATRFSRACFSSAFERAQGINGIPDQSNTRGEGTGPEGTPGISTKSRTSDPARQGMYEAKQEALDPDKYTRTGASQFMADTAKEGLRKATQVADTVGDAAKKTMDGAWEAAKEANQKIRDDISVGADRNEDEDDIDVGDAVIDEVHKLDGPVDTAEYRSMEDLKVKPEDRED